MLILGEIPRTRKQDRSRMLDPPIPPTPDRPCAYIPGLGVCGVRCSSRTAASSCGVYCYRRAQARIPAGDSALGLGHLQLDITQWLGLDNRTLARRPAQTVNASFVDSGNHDNSHNLETAPLLQGMRNLPEMAWTSSKRRGGMDYLVLFPSSEVRAGHHLGTYHRLLASISAHLGARLHCRKCPGSRYLFRC